MLEGQPSLIRHAPHPDSRQNGNCEVEDLLCIHPDLNAEELVQSREDRANDGNDEFTIGSHLNFLSMVVVLLFFQAFLNE